MAHMQDSCAKLLWVCISTITWHMQDLCAKLLWVCISTITWHMQDSCAKLLWVCISTITWHTCKIQTLLLKHAKCFWKQSLCVLVYQHSVCLRCWYQCVPACDEYDLDLGITLCCAGMCVSQVLNAHQHHIVLCRYVCVRQVLIAHHQ